VTTATGLRWMTDRTLATELEQAGQHVREAVNDVARAVSRIALGDLCAEWDRRKAEKAQALR